MDLLSSKARWRICSFSIPDAAASWRSPTEVSWQMQPGESVVVSSIPTFSSTDCLSEGKGNIDVSEVEIVVKVVVVVVEVVVVVVVVEVVVVVVVVMIGQLASDPCCTSWMSFRWMARRLFGTHFLADRSHPQWGSCMATHFVQESPKSHLASGTAAISWSDITTRKLSASDTPFFTTIRFWTKKTHTCFHIMLIQFYIWVVIYLKFHSRKCSLFQPKWDLPHLTVRLACRLCPWSCRRTTCRQSRC